MATPTDQALGQLEEALLNGAADADAARAAGLRPADLAEWETIPEIAERLEAARARNRIENLSLIKRAALGHPANIKTTTTDPNGKRTIRETERIERDWRAAAWLEERRPPAGRANPPRSTGPKSLLTPEVHAIIVESYRHNPHREPAAAAARISPRTLDSWTARGRQYRDFLDHGDIGDADAGTRRLYYAAQRLWATDRQAALSALALVEDRTTRPEDEPYLALVVETEHAVGQLELELSKLFLTACRERPELSERALRLLFRNRYGNRLELTGAAGGPIEHDLEATRTETLELLEQVSEGRDRL